MPNLTAGCIVFLDFDGVTHPDSCEVDELFLKLPLIEEVLREFGAWNIVISSSWREVHPLDEMREYFAPDMRSRVVGVTPVYPASRDPELVGRAADHERHWECEQWLQTNRVWLPHNRRTDAPWIAIDDRTSWFRPGCANLLSINAKTAFGADDATRLHSMLKKRLP